MVNRSKLVEDYFSVINTEKKAYFLGLIYADGCIREVGNNRQKTLTLVLQEEDFDIVSELNDEITPYKKATIQKPPSIIDKGWKGRANFTVSSDRLCNDLINIGCNINKSVVGIKLPNIPNELKKHFIRGYFDGNGGISIKKVEYKYKRISNYNLSKIPDKYNYRPSLYFCSTDIIFLNGIFNYLNKILKFKCVIQNYEFHTKNLVTYQKRIEHKDEVIRFYNYIYSDSTIYLNRKYEKFNMLIKSEDKSTLL